MKSKIIGSFLLGLVAAMAIATTAAPPAEHVPNPYLPFNLTVVEDSGLARTYHRCEYVNAVEGNRLIVAGCKPGTGNNGQQ